MGDDELIKQLNRTDNTNTREYIKEAMILLRKELNTDTTLKSKDYIRKRLVKDQENTTNSNLSTQSSWAFFAASRLRRAADFYVIDISVYLKTCLWTPDYRYLLFIQHIERLKYLWYEKAIYHRCVRFVSGNIGKKATHLPTGSSPPHLVYLLPSLNGLRHLSFMVCSYWA